MPSLLCIFSMLIFTSTTQAFVVVSRRQSGRILRTTTQTSAFISRYDRHKISFASEKMSSSRQFATSTAATTTPVSKSSTTNTKSIKEGVFSNASLLKLISTSRGGVASILISDESMKTTSTASSSSVASPSSLTETLFAPLELPKSNKSSIKAPPEEVLGKTVVFQSNDVTLEGMIIALRYPVAFVYFSDESSKQQNLSTLLTKENSVVKVLHSSTQTKLPTSNQEMVDCYGNNLLEPTTTLATSEPLLVDIFAPIPQVSEIQLINTPLVTGITMVDALAPIGRGQNMLVVGEEGTGRRNIANTAIQTQLSLGTDGTMCFYASTTPTSVSPNENVTLISTKNTKNNNEETEEDAVIRAAESIAIASSACSMAEYWARNHGKDTLVVIDTIDNHKAFWDYTTKALVDVYGLDSVVQEDLNGSASSEMRGFFSNLIQRSGRYNAQQGGGSVTLLVLVTIPTAQEDNEEEGGTSFHLNDFEGFHPKIQSRIHLLIQQNIRITPKVLHKLGIAIPPRTVEEHKRTNLLRHVDDLISMTDGQIWLSTDMLPMRPLVDPQRSITRVGIGADTDCRADAPALRNLVGGLRFELAQASSLEGATDVASQKQLLRKDAMLLAMYQDDDTTRMLWEECTCLLAARMGVLDASIQAGHGVGTTEGKQLLEKLLGHVQKTVAPDILREINNTFELNPVAMKALESSIQSFFI